MTDSATAGGDFTSNGQTITLTPGNRVAVEPASGAVKPGTFCLWASNTAESGYYYGTFYYDSDAGGLRTLGTWCA